MLELIEELHQLVRSLFPETEPARPTAATKPEFGDLQISAAMQLAKITKQKPRDVAARIVEAVSAHPAIERTEIAGPGFVNIWIKTSWLANAVVAPRREPAPRGTVVLDYSSPNAAKKMHIAHIRSTIIGDAIRRVLGAVGYRVVPVNHLGDWGTQFGKLIVAWRRWGNAEAFAADPVGELQKLYIQFVDEEKREGGELDDEGEEVEGKPAPPILQEARAETVKLQQGDAENFALWQRFRAASVKELQQTYQRLGVNFADEDFIGESFYNERLAATVDELLEKGIAEESRGAKVVFFRKPDGSDEMTPMIVRKSDGGFGYAATDIAALRYRTQTWSPVRIIIITDERQQLHFRQLIRVGERLGYTNLEHIWFGLMRLPEGTIKTRTGNLISLEALLDEAERRAYEVAKEQRPDAPDEELRKVARVVGLGAVKYNDLSKDRQTLVTFTWDKALALSGNTAPYLQYAYARIRSIQRKAEGAQAGAIVEALSPVEKTLVKQILWFPSALEQVASSLKPHLLCDYLFELSNQFSSFFDQCPVIKAETPELRASRLKLCELVADRLETGLDLLGIEVLDRM